MVKGSTAEVKFDGGGYSVRLLLGSATALMGMKRAMYAGRAQAYLESFTDEEDMATVEASARGIVVRLLYPDLMACLVSVDGLDPELGPAEFLELPEQLTDAWQNTTYELNPHWYPFARPGDDEDAVKNAEVPTSNKSDSGS